MNLDQKKIELATSIKCQLTINLCVYYADKQINHYLSHYIPFLTCIMTTFLIFTRESYSFSLLFFLYLVFYYHSTRKLTSSETCLAVERKKKNASNSKTCSHTNIHITR